MPLLETLVTLFEPWSTIYSESTALSVGLKYAHLGAMMVGGGLAIAADRTVIRAAVPVTPEHRVALADQVGSVHRPVVIALMISAVSGALLLSADLEALAANKVLWVKFGLLLLLAGNGALMLRDERALRRVSGSGRHFLALRARAFTSVALWLAITLAGVGLMQG